MSRFILFIALNLFGLHAQANMTIRITAPNTTPQSEVLYLAGNFNTWNPAATNYNLTPLGNFQYSVSIPQPTGGNAMLFKFGQQIVVVQRVLLSHHCMRRF